MVPSLHHPRVVTLQRVFQNNLLIQHLKIFNIETDKAAIKVIVSRPPIRRVFKASMGNETILAIEGNFDETLTVTDVKILFGLVKKICCIVNSMYMKCAARNKVGGRWRPG